MRKLIDYLISYIKRNFLFSAKRYWNNRYRIGGNSGHDLKNADALFKLEFIQEFVVRNNLGSINDFGCGDAVIASKFFCLAYTGYDISKIVINYNKCRYAHKEKMSFKLMPKPGNSIESADLGLSIDVIYHITSDEEFESYMQLLFDSSDKFVIIYSSDTDNNSSTGKHIRHRKFARWVKNNALEWYFLKWVPYTSDAAFFIYQRVVEEYELD